MMQRDYEYEVSVYCVTYNHEKYIRDALDGILNQKTSFTWKLIIFDDASTDGTTEIVREYERKYPEKIITLIQKENQYSKGNNIQKIIIPYLKGKYIATCEGDDYWIDEYKLQKQYDFLENHFDFIGCYHNIDVINEFGEKKISKEFPIRNRWIYDRNNAIKFELPGQTAAAFYKNFYMNFTKKQLKSYMECSTNGDRKIAVTLGMMGKIMCMEEIMAVHRVIINQGDSWHAQVFNKNMAAINMKSKIDMKKFVKDAFDVEVDIKADHANLLWTALRYYQKNRNKENLNILVKVWKMMGENNITKVWMMIQKIIQKSFSNFKGKKIVKSEKEIY